MNRCFTCDWKLDLDFVMSLGVLGGFNEQGPEREGYQRHSKLIAHLACEDCSNNSKSHVWVKVSYISFSVVFN